MVVNRKGVIAILTEPLGRGLRLGLAIPSRIVKRCAIVVSGQ
ncbi:hypothetical protein [Burkholderia territorii]|nr:hypothetical protein [Burkholderia territorii]